MVHLEEVEDEDLQPTGTKEVEDDEDFTDTGTRIHPTRPTLLN